MQLSNIDKLTDFDTNLKLTVFAMRYGGGVVAILGDEMSHLTAIENNFSGGDSDYFSVYLPLVELAWFPIAFGDTAYKALEALELKLSGIIETFSNPKEDLRSKKWKWQTCIYHVGKLIESDQYRMILNEESVKNLQDLDTALSLLQSKT